MKIISFYLLVLFAGFLLEIQSFGQSDSVKIDLNLSSEVLKKLDNKDIVEIIKFRDKLEHESEMVQARVFFGHGGFYGSLMVYNPVTRLVLCANIGQANPPYDSGELAKNMIKIMSDK